MYHAPRHDEYPDQVRHHVEAVGPAHIDSRAVLADLWIFAPGNNDRCKVSNHAGPDQNDGQNKQPSNRQPTQILHQAAGSQRSHDWESQNDHHPAKRVQPIDQVVGLICDRVGLEDARTK